MKQNNNKIEDNLFGKNKDKIPNIAFRIMTSMMNIVDLIMNKANSNFKTLGLKEGQVVVDYGCGPARYIENASKAVGAAGKVYAVDIHPLAIEKVNIKIKQKQLNNVEAVLADAYVTPINKESVDVVYALDMFHMVSSPLELLQEFHRLLKHKGIAIIEDGHQKRSESIEKIISSGLFTIIEESESNIKCVKK